MIQIAIDGPGGAGKTTLSKGIAKKLGIVYVDTGAMYRTVGLYVRDHGYSYEDTSAVVSLLPEIHIEVRFEDGVQNIYLNGVNPGERIREPEISMYASGVSKIPEVRAFLLETQKDIARKNSVIMDGRDIGTVILPDADLKLFMTASPETRAKRRYLELIEKGQNVTFEQVMEEMVARDAQDAGREIAPAIPADDAIMYDNSGLTFEESLDALYAFIQEKLGDKLNNL
ncbi:MAG: (d)CMP kinase [Clostridia bacterium]|nr:(d)CMP kinase [Clostridia bacterium]MBQ5792485.1 (d)CMP kinase [Clostridia bacterium]